MTQLNPSKSGMTQLNPSKSGMTQLNPSKSGMTQLNPSKRGMTPLNHREVNLSLRDNDETTEGGDESSQNGHKNTSDESFITSEIYLSLVWQSGYLGMAYYDLMSLHVYVMADVHETDDFSLVQQIIREVQPKVVVLSSLHHTSLLTCLKKQIQDESHMNHRLANCKVEFLPNSDFSFEVCKRRILSTRVPSIPQHFTDEERKLYFTSLLGMNSTCMVRAVGGLLKYLDKMRVGVELEDSTTHVPVLGFRPFTLESLIHIDTRTYLSLCIFHTDLHPSVYKFGTSSSKEGFSLFGIVNRCKSSIGSRMLRQWFLRPLKNSAVLRQRYDAISFFLKPVNLEAVTCLQGCLKNIKYIPRILLRMSKAQATIGDWLALSKTLYHAVYIGEACRALPQDVHIFRKIGTAFTDDLHRCYNLLCKTIDFEASKQSKRFVVQANVDQALDEKKRTFNGLPDLLNRVAREELKTLSEDIKECIVSYLPQIGYLLVLDMPEGQTETDDHTIEGLEYKFATNNQLFYKSPRTTELDRILGDTQMEITDMEVAIMHHLQDILLEKTQLMLDVMELSAELDCLMALAACANEFGYVCPTLTEEIGISVLNSRHPLQELCCDLYVPNHILMGGESSKIKLLTGPNACGKSVYLKQIGLVVFMAHIGSFVPAEKAAIGPVDQLFSCIKVLESVSAGLSTFMQECIQMSEALRLATPSSLVLVDEFGKGTDSTDGVALLTAVLKFWMARDVASPLVVISTHFHSLIKQNLLPASPVLQHLTLDTEVNGDELVFLYQIKEGHATSSYACNIATQVGIPSAIVKRAKEVSDLLAQGKPVTRLHDQNSTQQHARYERLVSAFLKLNLEKDDLQGFLQNYVLPQFGEPEPKSMLGVANIARPACGPQVTENQSQALKTVSEQNNERVVVAEIQKEAPGKQGEEPGEQREEPGDQREEPGDQREEPGDQREEPGEQREEMCKQREETGEQREEMGKQREETGKPKEVSGKQRERTSDEDNASSGLPLTHHNNVCLQNFLKGSIHNSDTLARCLDSLNSLKPALNQVKHDTSKNMTFTNSNWKNPSFTLKEHFMKTPLEDKIKKTRHERLTLQPSTCLKETPIVGRKQDNIKPQNDLDKQLPSDDRAKSISTKFPEKRRHVDMSFLFVSKTKQPRASVSSSASNGTPSAPRESSSSASNKTPSNDSRNPTDKAVAGGSGNKERGNSTSSTTATPHSETSLTAYPSSTDSQILIATSDDNVDS